MNTPILGSSYVARSVNAADNRMVNLFPEIIPEGGKEAAFLSRAPGLVVKTVVGDGPIRGMWVMGAYLYIVSGPSLYRIDASYNATFIGTVANDGKPVSMANGFNTDVDNLRIDQLFVCSTGSTYEVIINPVTGGYFFSIRVDSGFPPSGLISWTDEYFIFNEPGTERVWAQSSINISTFDPTMFRSADGSPDNVVGVIVDHREIWVFGTDSTEVWYNAGNAGFPFAPIPGAYSEIGCAASNSIAKMDNTVFWLGKDARGQGMVYRAKGYTGERISTHAIEWQIQQYGDLSNAIAYTYQQDGHAFYVLTFPDHNATWVYDASTESWHERAGFENGSFIRHRSNCQAFFNNLNLVGDYKDGTIYALDLNTYTDWADGQVVPQKWLRSWRALAKGDNKFTRTAHHSLQLDCESGVGLGVGDTGDGSGSDPQVMLRWSDDGGHTWSNEHWASMGKIGEFDRRVIWRRLGMTLKLRDRVYEISGTDPVKVFIMGAEIHMSNTNA